MSGAVKKMGYQTLAAFRYELRKFLHFSEVAAGPLLVALLKGVADTVPARQ